MAKSKLGRLSSLGAKEHWQVPLLLPKAYIDARHTVIKNKFRELRAGTTAVIAVKLESHDVNYQQRPPRTVVNISDKLGQKMSFTVFGDSRDLINGMQESKISCLHVKLGEYNGRVQIKIAEVIPRTLTDKILPIYKGKDKVIRPETVAERLREILPECIDDANKMLTSIKDHLIALNAPYKDITQLLMAIHSPSTPESGKEAQTWLKRISALETINLARESVIRPDDKESALGLGFDNALLEKVIKSLPEKMKLTDDQKNAIWDIQQDINCPQPMMRLLSGDVGTGKSLPIAISAAATAMLGKQAVILMPNAPLASQMQKDIQSWWPELNPGLVTGETKKMPDSLILVGTTALNFRLKENTKSKVKSPIPPPHLLIIDEQQKMSSEQRLSLAGSYTNVLEATATAVPRTAGLVQYGGMPISRLTKAYVGKDIISRINQKSDSRELFERVKHTIKSGYQALVIYPLVSADDNATDKEKKKTAEGAFHAWEQHFPGRVRFMHGQLSDKEKEASLDALRNGEADILCSTTAVEVGLNLSQLRHCVVVHPEKLGINTLHQLRGRLCRHGGKGFFDMYTPEEIKPEAKDRLNLIVKHTNGFELQEADMRMRGFGDLGKKSNSQTGAHEGFIPNYSLQFEEIDWLVKNEAIMSSQKDSKRLS